MRVHLGRAWPARGVVCVGMAAAVWMPRPALAQSMQFGGSAGAEAQVGPESGASGHAGGELSTAPAPATRSAEAPPGPAPSSRSHTVVEGDTLWGVSETYYHDPYAWPRLWSYNPQVTNPHYIYPGDVLALTEDGAPGGAGAGGAGGFEIGAKKAGPSRRVVSHKPAQTVLIREQAYLDADALQQAGTIMGSPATHMLLSVSDEVYVEFEEDPHAPVGREMIIYRRYTKEENSPIADDPYVHDPESPGEMVRIVGAVEILAYDREKKVARAEIIEGMDEIERGFRVADQPRRFVQVAPQTNQQTLESTVVAAIQPVQLIGQNQLVYVGVGAQQGVQAGNRFFVFRQGDEWRATLPRENEAFMGAVRPRKDFPEKEAYPEEIVAELMVLHTRPESSTAIVTHAIREVVAGDQVRMPDGY